MIRLRLAAAGVLVALTGAGCHNTPTTPSTTSTNTITTFASRLQVGGSAWKSFVQSSATIVTAQLSILFPDTEVAVRIGFGTLEGTTCTPTTTADATPNDTGPELSQLLPAGRYCLLITDIGNLTGVNDFAIVLTQNK